VTLRALIPVAAVVAVAAGCGSQAQQRDAATTIASPSGCHLTAAARSAIARSRRDLARLRAVAAKQTGYTVNGTTEMQLATGRYVDDLSNSPIDGLRRNRLIDLGVSVVTGFCGSCFQMLEASRPIPELKYSPTGCT
jgi:hypothetical protein